MLMLSREFFFFFLYGFPLRVGGCIFFFLIEGFLCFFFFMWDISMSMVLYFQALIYSVRVPFRIRKIKTIK